MSSFRPLNSSPSKRTDGPSRCRMSYYDLQTHFYIPLTIMINNSTSFYTNVQKISSVICVGGIPSRGWQQTFCEPYRPTRCITLSNLDCLQKMHNNTTHSVPKNAQMHRNFTDRKSQTPTFSQICSETKPAFWNTEVSDGWTKVNP